MLTAKETAATAAELQENYQRLGYPIARVAQDTELSSKQIESILTMTHPEPGNVWKLRDYLEDMLIKEGKEVYPFSRLADHSANRWFYYDTPWRTKSSRRK